MTEQIQEQDREKFFQLVEKLWGGLEQRMIPFGETDLTKVEALGVYYQGTFWAGDGRNILDRMDILTNPLVQTISAYSSPKTLSQVRGTFLTADLRLFLDRHQKNITTGGWFKPRKTTTEITHWGILKKEVPGAHPLYLASSSPVFPFYEGERDLQEIIDMVLGLGRRLYIHKCMKEFASLLDTPCNFYNDKKFPEEGEIVPLP